MSNYRKIYEQHCGPIPKDENGRTYDIHHIDGNHSNNSPENLKAVTIQEHYDIHSTRGDWYGCLLIALRMKLSPSELSELARKNNQCKVENGTHHWLSGDLQREAQNYRVKNGTHHFLGENNPSHKRIKDGTHNLLRRPDGSSQGADQVIAGTHNFLGENNPSHKRVACGTHNLLKENRKKVTCIYCNKIGDERLMKRYHFDNCKFKPPSQSTT